MISSFFPALLGKPAEQFFIHIAHLKRRKIVRPDLQLLVLVQNRREPIVLHHLSDGGAIVKELDDLIYIFGEAVDVGAKVIFEQRMVFLVDLAQCPIGLVGKWRLLWILLELLY